MDYWRLDNWCIGAVDKIKYPPDRKAVQKELRQHLDDRCEDFLAQGMTEEEAIRKTLETMGDYDQIADQLAAIHRPFWGFAYSISKWLLIIIAAVMVIHLIVGMINHKKAFISIVDWVPASSAEYKPMRYVQPECKGSSDGYTFTVKQAQITELVYTYDDGTRETKTYLFVFVNITTLNPLALPCEGADAFWGTDNRGLHYAQTDIQYRTSSTKYPFSNNCIFQIPLDSYEDLTWFELHYDREGRDLVLHIDMTGGDAV